ncbi:hypothetical protein [Kitasatospora camelliae]|uniref:Uncharacterized protein n=1 Tax=Kitasatospora camelliae TaxID=3156397 RepID=A0AAU8JV06_9ACTN
MSYELHALIADADLIHVVAAEVPVAQVVRLEQGLALIPMTERLYAALHQESADPAPGFRVFPGGFARRLSAWSKAGPIAYVETERADTAPGGSSGSGSGGSDGSDGDATGERTDGGGDAGDVRTGVQRAAVWEDGRLTLGPLNLPEAALPPAEGTPLARALRLLGAGPGEAGDESDAVGLGLGLRRQPGGRLERA